MYMQKAGACGDLGRSYLVALEKLAADGQELLLHVLEPRLGTPQQHPHSAFSGFIRTNHSSS
jgi:hypothetical protein